MRPAAAMLRSSVHDGCGCGKAGPRAGRSPGRSTAGQTAYSETEVLRLPECWWAGVVQVGLSVWARRSAARRRAAAHGGEGARAFLRKDPFFAALAL